MRATSAILLLVAFTVNPTAGSSAKKHLAGNKEDHAVDTTIKNNEDAFLFASTQQRTQVKN